MRFGRLRSSKLAKALAILAWVLVSLVSVATPAMVASAAECCRAAQEAAAEATDDCCAAAHDEPSASSESDSCPCPLPCAIACRAHVQSTLPGSAVPLLTPPLDELASTPPIEQLPPGPEPGDILHVPKTLRS